MDERREHVDDNEEFPDLDRRPLVRSAVEDFQTWADGEEIFPPETRNSEISNDKIEFNRLISDVCSVFKDVTGITADPRKDAPSIVVWGKRGWKTHDFRLVIEHHYRDEKSWSYFKAHPEKMNLRGILNPLRENILLDIHAGVKAALAREERKQEIQTNYSRMPMMLMRCGVKVAVGDRKAYDHHMKQCFAVQGACFA